ncbi:MAG: RNA polymerase subunit sigma-70 [Sandarakinorhabdus sp.]|nr:RNA polymerase subunit sigma-70 [Sandarakinorhabdus sp.]
MAVATNDPETRPVSHAPNERLLALCYGELRAIARRVLRADGAQLQLQPTDLAHEAAIRIMHLDRIEWQGRTHFLAVSARVMRQALLDEVRHRKAAKRQAPEALTLWPGGGGAVQLDAFDDALERLFAFDADRARIVELRFYAGLTMAEVASTQGISISTAERRWRSARAWLIAALADSE